MKVTVAARTCPMCHERHTFEVTEEVAKKIEEWESGRDGRFIQEALPELSPDERELLLTGIDGECWKGL